MGKKLFSLCMALTLCLGLLPVTALAAGEIKLFIGGQQIAESGCYENQDGTWTKVDGTEPASGQFYYDAATFTLTLNQAEITHDKTVTVAEGYTYYGSVIAFSQTADVSLKIVVSQGTSTITGTGGIRVESTTGDVSLSIAGPGSLDVEPKGSSSGITLCSSKDMNLDIDGADVTASSPAHYGVYLISSTDATSTSTITVNNGSLTTGGNGNVGIYYYWSGTSNAGTSSLTVSDNAVVDTRNSRILTNNEKTGVQVGAGSDGNGGIVFNGKSGTVYGDVTLEDDLEIASGETLTIPDDSSLNSNGKLTNNGKIIVDNGGKLEGTINGNQPPKITTERLNDGTVNTKYNQTLVASGDATITWSSSDLPNWLTLNSDGTISGTPTAAGTSTFTVKANNNYGSDSKSLSITIGAQTNVPVTGVSLNTSTLNLIEGGTGTLIATVEPNNATNKNVTWSSEKPEVATVEGGTVKAVGAGTAIITVTTADGGKTATCTVTVSRYSSGGGSSSSSTSLSDRAIDDIQDARPGDTVEITLRPGRTTLEREVFEALAGQDITLEIDAGDGVLWTVNGLDIPEDTRLHDLDLDVDLGDSGIPATVLNAVTGEIGTVQLSLAHDGQFGFTMTLSAPLGRDNADYWANLYWFNERTDALEFQQAARIANDGTAEFALNHASDYAIVIDDRSHEPVDLPFTDVPEGYWAYGAIQYVYGEGLMAGASGTTFAPEGTTTRGQIVTILWRLSGSPQVDYLLDFSDVAGGAYYTEAVRWAVSEGIAGGYGGGVFGPNDPITREQLAVMLHRYAQHEGYDVSIGEDTNILSYTDAFDVSEYAVAALQWACGAGIIHGTGDGSTLTPQGEATRAQAATVLMRFCEQYQ